MSDKSFNLSPRPGNCLVLGLGNILMGDEGIGVHALRALEKEALPEGVVLLDGGTGGFHLMEYLEAYPCVIMVDATLEGEPGSIRILEPRFSTQFPTALSTHDIGLKDLIESLNILGRLPQIKLVAVSIDRVQPMKLGLSLALEAAIPKILRAVREQVSRSLEEVDKVTS
jgi:hydrogenase maturation protease